jgi:protein-disulfide isomerase
MGKAWIVVLVVVILAFGGLVTWSLTQGDKVDYASFDSTRVIGPNEANGQIGDHVAGNPDAKVIIVEWGDFSCSHCASENPLFKRVADSFGDRIGWIYRNFPLNGYPNSLSAASVAEAAGWQGYYWEMSDALFANQALWYTASESARMDLYVSIFQQAAPEGDVERLKADMADPRIAKKIDFDKNLGKLKDIPGTPALFYNGEKIDGSIFGDEAKFKQFIEEKLAAAE